MPKNIDQELHEFLSEWDVKSFSAFLKDVMPITELYQLDDDDTLSLQKYIDGDQEHVDTVIMVRTAYLMSRFVDFHAGKLLSLRTSFRGFWKRLEESAK